MFLKNRKFDWGWARKKLIPTDREMAHAQGREFVASLMSKFSIEEQSEVILEVRNVLIGKRIDEIRETEEFLAILKKDLKLLQSQQQDKI